MNMRSSKTRMSDMRSETRTSIMENGLLDFRNSMTDFNNDRSSNNSNNSIDLWLITTHTDSLSLIMTHRDSSWFMTHNSISILTHLNCTRSQKYKNWKFRNLFLFNSELYRIKCIHFVFELCFLKSQSLSRRRTESNCRLRFRFRHLPVRYSARCWLLVRGDSWYWAEVYTSIEYDSYSMSHTVWGIWVILYKSVLVSRNPVFLTLR